MTTTGRQATNPPEDVKEMDSVKESISDIINQLQDIDPARLSFSPFLDLDTQISLAPVSDSPESSVEELHSSSPSASGSQRSLDPPAAGPDSCPQQPESLTQEPPPEEGEEGAPEGTVSSPVATTHDLEDTVENCCIHTPNPDSTRDIPNGTDTPRWSPESNHLDSTVDEGRPLMGQESVELELWGSPEQDCGEAVGPRRAQGRRCCCSCCGCCQSGRAPAVCSLLASLLCAAGVLYALYFHVAIETPDCPDVVSRLTFTLRCCAVAATPVILGMLMGGVCRFCSGSLSPAEALPRRPAAQQLFVTSSTEQLVLYALNLVVLATLLPQEQLRVVPILAAMFVLGRLVYWLSLHTCGPWRSFGSGLSMFPLLAMVAFNLFSLCDQGLRWLSGPEDMLLNQTSPSSWPVDMVQSGLDITVPTDTDILDIN